MFPRRDDTIPTWPAALALAAAGAIAALILFPGTLDRTPNRFAAVDAGRLYRGGYPDPAELRWLANSVGVRSVVSLMHDDSPADRSREEARTAASLGLQLKEFAMPGDGRADFELLDAAADAIADGMREGPVYLHCSAGKQRSNAATAAYRMKHCGWTADQAIDELKVRFDLDPAAEARLADHLRAYYEDRIRPR